MAEHNKLGTQGETIAIAYLQNKQHKILERNWRYLKYEIDIISWHNNLIIFTEVKTRSSYKYGFPDESVNNKKELMLVEAAEIYLEEKDLYYEVRFDIISIIKNEKESKVYHIEDAFRG